MIEEKTFYRAFFALTLSLALQNLLTFGVNLMDTVMLGRYSQEAMSGVSLCNQIQFLLQMLVGGAGEGAVVLGSQYWGKGRLEPIPSIIGVALRFGAALSALLFALVLLWPRQLLGLLSNDDAVIAQGAAYFQIICFSYIIFTVTNILVASLRSVGVVKIGYVISFSTLCINVTLNYLLIYGNLGCPELGVRGAAIATLVSRCVELAIVVYYLKYREEKLDLTLKKLIFIDTSYRRDYDKVSAPVLVNQALWGVAQMVQTGILGHLGGDVTAANAIAVQVYQVLSVVAYGAASAAGIVVGRSIGGGRRDADADRPAAGAPIHGRHRRDHGGHLLSDGLRHRHHPGRGRHRLQREDEPHQHVGHRGALLGHGGLLVEGPAGGGVLPAEVGPDL